MRDGRAIDCLGAEPSPYDVGSGVWSCGATADSGDACFPAAQGAEMLCLVNPFKPEVLLRVAKNAGGPLTPRKEDAYPMGLLLDDGTQCRAVIGGAWGQRGAPNYECGGSPITGIWGSPSDWHGITRGPDGWTVQVSTETGPATRHQVKSAYFVEMA